MMSDRFVSALGMVASGLRLFQLPYCVIQARSSSPLVQLARFQSA